MNDSPAQDVLAATQIPTIQQRVEYDMPAEQYHATEAMSASGAKVIRRSPAHFRVWRTQKKAPTADMIFGTALHLAVLEPERIESSLIVAPNFNRRTNAGKAEAESFEAANAGRIILDAGDFDRCLRARDAVAAHAGAQRLLAGTRKEVSIFWNDGRFGVPCKMRADAIRDSDFGLVDVKTTADASREAFGRSIATYQYHLQAAMYVSGVEHVLCRTPAFFAFIAVEKDEPYGCACYVMESAHILAGARLMDEALSLYRDAIAGGGWRGYEQTIQPALVPSWALRFNQ